MFEQFVHEFLNIIPWKVLNKEFKQSFSAIITHQVPLIKFCGIKTDLQAVDMIWVICFFYLAWSEFQSTLLLEPPLVLET